MVEDILEYHCPTGKKLLSLWLQGEDLLDIPALKLPAHRFTGKNGHGFIDTYISYSYCNATINQKVLPAKSAVLFLI